MSSSPEQDFIGLHIRAVGTWTNKLYEFVDAISQAQKQGVEEPRKRLQLKTPGADVIDEKDKEAEREIAITVDTTGNTGSLDQNGNYSKHLEAR